MNKEQQSFSRLEKIYKNAPEYTFKKSSKYIIFSDLHLGNGKKRKDDFFRNSEMFLDVLESYYLKNDYTLVLNGDIEELMKFSPLSIQKNWKAFYVLCNKFFDKDRLIKIIGNHELSLDGLPRVKINKDVKNGVRLNYNKNQLFIFHGHQAVLMFNRFSGIISVILRFLARPLGIKNRTASHDSKRKYEVERLSYLFSTKKKIVSIIGHTHRPMFESFSKYDTLRFTIEMKLRSYPDLRKKEQVKAKREIIELREELERLTQKEKNPKDSFYHEYLIYPCLFNSGCVIGKRGMTGIELMGGEISLVHWYDIERKKKAWVESDSVFILDGKFHKRIIKSDNLEYIFNRIELLG